MCDQCDKLKIWFEKTYPKRMGHIICEECYESSKEYITYLNLDYEPKGSYETRIRNMVGLKNVR